MGVSPIRSIVRIPVGDIELEGALESPAHARGVVVFAHGAGSSRMSPRNRFVAGELRRAGLATLLTDLLTEAEDQDRARRFDIARLRTRLDAAVRYAQSHPVTAGLPIGLFGASTGAAAALELAAARGETIEAVVSRGGRPDLASAGCLAEVTAPTLLIVGGEDFAVIPLNDAALAELRCPRELRIVPGATHLFEEPGALEAVARLAGGWFTRHLGRESRAA